MLNEIKAKLEELNLPVHYGLVGDTKDDDIWDYIVFMRNRLAVSNNKTAYSEYYTVAVISEEYIEEGFEEKLINKMLEIDGFRVSGDGDYNYTKKPKTGRVIEIFTIDFIRAKKKV